MTSLPNVGQAKLLVANANNNTQELFCRGFASRYVDMLLPVLFKQGQQANDYKAFFDKGIRLRKNGDWGKSIVEFENSIKIKPTFEAYYECACSYSNIGQYKTSVDLYQKAADLDTTNKEVRQRIKNLKEYHKLD